MTVHCWQARNCEETACPAYGLTGDTCWFRERGDCIRLADDDESNVAAQFRQSQKMEAVGRLAGGIAHDFNNVLTAIIGYTSLLNISVQDDPKLLHYVEQIDMVVKKASKLTKDILAFSSKQVINPKPVDLVAVMGGVEHVVRRVIGDNIAFTMRHHPAPLVALVDAVQFQQVILNMVTNARDAMPGGGSLSIETGIAPGCPTGGANPNPGQYALVTVTDSGIGMDRGTCERIFEPFYTTKDVGKGTGLGLSIAFGIVNQHRGALRVESKPKEGTRFLIYLPMLGQDPAVV